MVTKTHHMADGMVPKQIVCRSPLPFDSSKSCVTIDEPGSSTSHLRCAGGLREIGARVNAQFGLPKTNSRLR